MNNNVAYENLLKKIDVFIKKYYKNKMIKGLLLFVFFAFIVFVSVMLLEYFGRFNRNIRTVLFFSTIITSLFLLVKYILFPLTKLIKFGKIISYEEASKIIGSLFPKIDDKLLNTLQLKSNSKTDKKSSLLIASIEQRSNELSVFSFSSGINFSENKKYLFWVFIIFSLTSFIIFLNPKVLLDSSERIVNYRKTYIPENPFSFEINDCLEVVEGNDLNIKVNLIGKDFPKKVYIKTNKGLFLMDKKSKKSFSFLLKKVKKNQKIQFNGTGIYSSKYDIILLKKPQLSSVDVELFYPKYLNIKNKKIKSAGDINIPEGTIIKWIINVNQADNVELFVGDSVFFKKNIITKSISFSKKQITNEKYKIRLSRKDNNIKDSSINAIYVIKDQNPSINVKEEKDSNNNKIRFFSGYVSDDYGLSSLSFIANINKRKKDSTYSINKKININTKFNSSNFIYQINFNEYDLRPEDEISYYFLIRDNDKPNGYKKTKSKTFIFKVPGLIELSEKNNIEKNNIEKKLNNLIKKTSEFKNKIKNIKNKSIETKGFDWKQKNNINNLIEEQKNIESELEKINEEIIKNQEEQNNFLEKNEDFYKKQKEVQKLMKNIIDEELKSLLEELKKMIENQNKNKINEKIKKIDSKTENINKQLENSLELLKRLEIEEKNNQIAKNLEKLSEEEKKLSEEVKKNKIDKQLSIKKQNKIESDFEKIKNDIDRLMKKNKELDSPMNLSKDLELEKEIKENIQKSKNLLDKNKNQKASEIQKKASEKMKSLSKKMLEQMQIQLKDQHYEDINAIRMLLENIITLSFEQESIMKKFNNLSKSNPLYIKLGKEQQKIIEDTKIVEDSLNQLSKRIPKVSNFVFKELNKIKKHEQEAKKEFGLRETKKMLYAQQKVMTSFNNLALFFSESLKKMQLKAKNSSAGSGTCPKPGGNKSNPSPKIGIDEIKKLLKKQLEDMQKGSSPGGKKEGNKMGFNLKNKEISELVRQQSELRKKLKKLAQKLNGDGSGKGNSLNNIAKELEKLEKDLVNKRFQRDIIKRQKEIYTRLLESEKALKEEEFDNKRKSKSGKNKERSNFLLLKEYKKKKLKEIELLKNVPAGLNIYYKNKANEYINKINK